MPLRQPRSLQSLQSDRPAIQRTKPVVIAHSNSPEQLPRANTTRVVTAVPTPMAPVKGFSEVRRNVFKPGQGEFVAIMIKLDAAEHVEVSVFNMNGRKVISLLDETRNPGVHEVRWSGYNSHGDASATGKYLVVVKSLKKLERHKVALIR